MCHESYRKRVQEIRYSQLPITINTIYSMKMHDQQVTGEPHQLDLGESLTTLVIGVK